MISAHSHSKEWIQQKRKELGDRHDPALIEKVIKALTLLEQLRSAGLDFIFKGGTALLLLLDKPLRFSIDIDVVLPRDARANSRDLTAFFDKLLTFGQFLRHEKDSRHQGSLIPKEHHKFYYRSVLNGRDDNCILLDILYEDTPYPEIIRRPIHSFIVENTPTGTSNVEVQLPTIDGLLGDKLTAFAPKTTGIPFGTERDLEIIKQLFDLANLFEQPFDLAKTRAAFDRVVAQETGYRRQSGVRPLHVLDDCFDAALTIAVRGKNRPQPEFTELSAGIKKLGSYVFQRGFHLEHAINCSAKVACLSMAIRSGATGIVRFSDKPSLPEKITADGPFSTLNKLKKSDVEAFYYWHTALEFHSRI